MPAGVAGVRLGVLRFSSSAHSTCSHVADSATGSKTHSRRACESKGILYSVIPGLHTYYASTGMQPCAVGYTGGGRVQLTAGAD